MPPVKEKCVVAVTGANGFVGSHVCRELLEKKYKVRCVVRNADDNNKVSHLKKMAQDHKNSNLMSFYSAEFESKESYKEAFSGANAVIHCAGNVTDGLSPGGGFITEDEFNLYIMGVQNILESLDESKSVQRFVYVGSLHSMVSPDKPTGTVFNEEDWNDWSSLENGDSYAAAITKAERLIWKHSTNKHYDVVVLSCGRMIGPCLASTHVRSTPGVFVTLLRNEPLFNFFTQWADVRAVSKALVHSLTSPKASNERFLIGGFESEATIRDIFDIVQREFPDIKIEFNENRMMGVLIYLLSYMPGIGPNFMTEGIRHSINKRFRGNDKKVRLILDYVPVPLPKVVYDTVKSIKENSYHNNEAHKHIYNSRLCCA